MTRINDVIYGIRKSPNGKPMIVHYNRLAPYSGENEQAETRVREVEACLPQPIFEEFMTRANRTIRTGVTTEEHLDLSKAPTGYSLAHCVAADLRMFAVLLLYSGRNSANCRNYRSKNHALGKS